MVASATNKPIAGQKALSVPKRTKNTTAHPFGRSSWRLVINTFPRFVSIFLITVIGVAFFAGLRVTGNYMRANADLYLNATNSMDIRIVSTFGFDDADIEAIRQTTGVADIYAGYNTNMLVDLGQNAVSTQLLSFDPRSQVVNSETVAASESAHGGEKNESPADPVDAPSRQAINCPWLLDGRLPRYSGECLVEQRFLRQSGRQIGDSVHFISGNDKDISDTLKRDTFTIVGCCDTPLFLAEDRGTSEIGTGSNSYFFLLVEEDFTISVHTEVYIEIVDKNPDGSRFATEYYNSVTAVINQLDKTGEQRSPLRFADVLEEANQKLDDAQAEVDDGYAELEDARQQLVDARRELDEGWTDAASGRLKLDEARDQLHDANIQINIGWDKLRRAYIQIEDARAELAANRPILDAARKELEAARVELESAALQLQNSRIELDDGWAQAQDGYEQLQTSLRLLEASKAALDLAWQLLDAGRQSGLIPQWLYNLSANQLRQAEVLYQNNMDEWQAGMDAYNQAVDKLQEGEDLYASGLADYLDGLARYQSGLDEYLDGEAEYQAGYDLLVQGEADYLKGYAELQQATADYEQGLADYRQGEVDYAEGLVKLLQGEADYADGLQEYQEKRDDALIELADAQREIDDARADLLALKPPHWYVLGIRDNAGFRTFESESSQLDALAYILPGFFFLIAALVSMTAMTRLVDSERMTIATFKALGYKNSVITLRYLLYALSATTLGSLAGIALGYTLLPPMIFDAFRTLFNIPHTVSPISYEYIAISAAIAILSTVLPAMSVVRTSVRENPATAMRPLAPRAGQRILLERLTPLWRRMSFLQKVTARNLFRYKKRLFMTVFGVAGCTALIFTALGLHDSLSTVTSKQFGYIYKSDVTLDIKLSEDENGSDFANQLTTYPEIADFMLIYQRSMRVSNSDLTKDLSLIVVFDKSALPDFIHMAPRKTGFSEPVPLTLGDDGVILTEQIARQFKVGVGDSINLRTLEGDSADFLITGIVENYTLHYCYMSSACYDRAFGEVAKPNRVFIKTVSGTGELPTALTNRSTVTAIMNTAKRAAEVSNQLDVLTFVVVILIISAAVLISVVLFSLTTINIEERRRELASIKVLGFFERELAAYIYRENIILTIVGAAVGIGLGFLLQRYIITTLEIDLFMFSRDLLWTSYAISLSLTFVFAAIVNLIMYGPLTRVNMVEALKAVE